MVLLYIALGFLVYWAIGFLVLKYVDPWGLGGWIAMNADSRHRRLGIVFYLLAIGWFLWPLQLIWRKR